MQTDLGREVDARTLTASYIYAARYGYSDTVVSNDNQLRIFPRDGEGQIPLQSQLWTLPEGRGVEYGDRFGNRVRRVRVVEQHTSLVVATVGQVSLSIEPPFPDDLDLEDVANIPDRLEYTMRSPLVDPEAVAVLAQHVAGSADSWMGRVRNVTDWVYWHIRYKRGSTDVSPVNGSFVSKGGATECAAVAQVRFDLTEAALDDALRLLDTAFVVHTGVAELGAGATGVG